MTGLGIAAAFVLLWCALLYVPFRWRPVGLYLIIEKSLALGYAPFIAGLGMALAAVGAVSGSWWIAVPAGIAAVGALVVIVRVGSARVDLSGALGSGWQDRVPAERRRRMIRRWWTGPLRSDPEPRLRRDVPFATVPGTGRVLLCDVWQPPLGVRPSGLAVVYLHGSAWYVLDKDLATRPLFRHLAAQGHVVVDVAYRLFPEADVPGMVGDAKRAVAWVREHATELAVDRDRIVLAGGSAGGHLSLLAAYGPAEPALTPPELAGSDLRVRAVVSLYGPASVDALYWHTSQDKYCRQDDRQPDWTAPPSRALVRLFGAQRCPAPAAIHEVRRAHRLARRRDSRRGARGLRAGFRVQLRPAWLPADAAHARDPRRDGARRRNPAAAAPARGSRRAGRGGVPAPRRPPVRPGRDPVVAGRPGRLLCPRTVPRGDQHHRAADGRPHVGRRP